MVLSFPNLMTDLVILSFLFKNGSFWIRFYFPNWMPLVETDTLFIFKFAWDFV